MKDSPEILNRVATYYSEKLASFGPTHKGVDWNSIASQEMRFDQFSRLLPNNQPFSLLDYGCGYGAYYDFLSQKGTNVQYVGYDISKEMIAAARQSFPEKKRKITWLDRDDKLPVVDYVVASGIFNVKCNTLVSDWEAYIQNTLDKMESLARKGFAFNMLTTYSDIEIRKIRKDLYYASPTKWFPFYADKKMKVALLHDYPLYEFTLIVHKPVN